MKYKKIVIILFALNLAVLAGYSFLFSVVLGKERSSLFLEEEARREASREQELSGLKDLVADTSSEREKVGSYFLHADDIVSFIERVESLGLRAGISVDFETVTIQEDRAKSFLALRFTTEGSFAGSYYFLQLLETLPYTFSFERVFLDKEGGGNDVWTGEYTVELLSFVNE